MKGSKSIHESFETLSQPPRKPKRQKIKHSALEKDNGKVSKSIIRRFPLVSKRDSREKRITADPVSAFALATTSTLPNENPN
jgi:hypothetical protein